MRYAPICEQLSPDVKRGFICCAVGSHYRAALIRPKIHSAPRAGMPDPPEGVVLPVRPDDASRYGWRTRAGSAVHPAPPLAVRPALGASWKVLRRAGLNT